MQSSASAVVQDLVSADDVGAATEPSSLTLEELTSVNGALGEVSAAVESTFLGASKRTMQTVRDLRHVSQLVERLAATPEVPFSVGVETLAVDARSLQCDPEESAVEWTKLLGVARKVDAMCAELESLDRCYQMFPVLRVLTQIHGSSLNEESRDLDWFADAIGSEADRGSEVVGNLLVTVKRQAHKLRASIRAAFEGEHHLREKLQDSEAVLLRCAQQLNTLGHGNENALQALQTRQRSITSTTTDLVSSMQFQDAFRQRVEHVQHALEQLISLNQRQVLPGFDADRTLSGAEVSVAQTVLVSIVNDQTGSLARDLAQEHAQLDDSLHRLGEQSDALQVELQGTLRNREQQQAEDQLEHTLRGYGTQVGLLAKINRGRAAITSGLQASLEEMDADLLALEQVGEAIFLLAVNAVVLAARLGAEGRAIEQIAQQVRSNSTEAGSAIRLVRKLTEELRAMCTYDISKSASEAQADVGPAGDDGEDIVRRPALRSEADLRGRSADLMVTLEDRREQSDEVVGFCRNIHDGYVATRGAFGHLREAIRTLSQTSAAWTVRADEHTLDPSVEPDLVRALASYFDAHYTMESERITQSLALMLGTDATASNDDESSDVVQLEAEGADEDDDDDDLSDILF